MSFLEKLNYVGLNDAKIDEHDLDGVIKELIDSLFGGNALDVIKYKHPKLNQSLNELTHYYTLLGLESNLDEVGFKIELANCTYKLTNLDKKRTELVELETNLDELNEAKKKLIVKKEHLMRLQKKGNVIDNLKVEVKKVQNEFKDCYDKAKATEKVLEDIGFRTAYSVESMTKLREEITNVQSRIEELEEYTQLFEDINSESDLKLKIKFLNEKLKNYKDFFIKNEEEI